MMSNTIIAYSAETYPVFYLHKPSEFVAFVSATHFQQFVFS